MSSSVFPPLCGTVRQHTAGGMKQDVSSTQQGQSSVPTGRNQEAAQAHPTTPDTSAPGAEKWLMELRSALELKRCNPGVPYRPEAWRRHLETAGLMDRYPSLPTDLEQGFDVGIPIVSTTFTPSNKPSINDFFEEYNSNTQTEFERGRYVGPASRAEVEALLGPFQTSPLSIVPKPAKPGKFRLIQNLSYPLSPIDGVTSINSNIDSSRFPCTWGTFSVVCLLILRLPPGSQAAVRDVKEAYHTIPVKPIQWPGLVVRLHGEDRFAIDTRNCFGLTSGAGCYGIVGDAGAQIMRANGIGPISKWVDDHLFCRIPKRHLPAYNELRRQWAQDIKQNGGELHDGGRLWFRGQQMPSGKFEEFDEDSSFPLRDLSSVSLRSDEDKEYTYCMADIDTLCEELGIPWEVEKDVPFQSSVPFIGLQWDLEYRKVSIARSKQEKYLAAIATWEESSKHTLEEAQKLYGKLLQACLVVPAGRAYLTNLEAFMGLFHDRPYVLRTPPRHTAEDLHWWKAQLQDPNISRPIPRPTSIVDVLAYSDASSEIGIGITIGIKWRAWRLLPGWKANNRDIGWAEAIGFLLLVITLQSSFHHSDIHYTVYGDNRGVVEGWWKGRSRNWPTNGIFRFIHKFSQENNITVHTRYVTSKENPADGPSRGEYGATENLLPAICIPSHLKCFIIDYDAPHTPTELRLMREGKMPSPAPRIDAAIRNLQSQRALEGQILHEEELLTHPKS